MIKKLKSRAGLTLTELMVTTVILSLFSMAALVGISTAFSARRSHILAADADILKASVTEVITQEIRLGKGFQIVRCDKDADGNEVESAVEDGTAGPRLKYNNAGTPVVGQVPKDNAVMLIIETERDGKHFGRLYKRFDLRKVEDDSDPPKTEPFYQKIMSDMAYGEGGNLSLKNLSFTMKEKGGKHFITVQFDIYEGEDRLVTSADFDVVPINQ